MGRPETSFGPRINDRIRITPVRLIDENGEMVGVVETDDARRRAMEAGLDLVEIAADVRPPVCKIMDFGKYKYELSKKDKQGKKPKGSEMKEVRLGRSMKIDPHDVAIRVAQARDFLIEGYRVVFVQNFRGRELAFSSKGTQRMSEIAQELSDVGKVEMTPRLAGKRMSMIMVPDRAKIDAIKHKQGSKPAAKSEAKPAAKPEAKPEAKAEATAESSPHVAANEPSSAPA